MAALNPAPHSRLRSVLLHWGVLVCLLMPILVASVTVDAQAVARQASEREIKAAYISKFGSYVEWPRQANPQSGAPFRIGVVGDEPLADDLAQMVAGRTVNGKPVTVQKLASDAPIPVFDMLFIGQAENDRLPAILASTKGRPTLTISESHDALALGSIINFIVVDGRVRFEIAPEAAERANLSISARLLAVAYRVVQGSKS